MTDDPKNRDLTDDDLTFAAGFPESSRADWMALVESVLKGAPFDAKLVSRTYDNLRIEPLYERAAGIATPRRPSAGRAMARDAARRSSRCGHRQQAGA